MPGISSSSPKPPNGKNPLPNIVTVGTLQARVTPHDCHPGTPEHSCAVGAVRTWHCCTTRARFLTNPGAGCHERASRTLSRTPGVRGWPHRAYERVGEARTLALDCVRASGHKSIFFHALMTSILKLKLRRLLSRVRRTWVRRTLSGYPQRVRVVVAQKATPDSTCVCTRLLGSPDPTIVSGVAPSRAAMADALSRDRRGA